MFCAAPIQRATMQKLPTTKLSPAWTGNLSCLTTLYHPKTSPRDTTPKNGL
jgi:hypothetical protein